VKRRPGGKAWTGKRRKKRGGEGKRGGENSCWEDEPGKTGGKKKREKAGELSGGWYQNLAFVFYKGDNPHPAKRTWVGLGEGRKRGRVKKEFEKRSGGGLKHRRRLLKEKRQIVLSIVLGELP